MAEIELKSISKRWGNSVGVDNFNLTIADEEFLVLLGPSGCGKTTTMRILTGYLPPTDGEARIAGFDVVSESLEVRRRVGYLPETVPLYPDMTVFDYLKFMADLRHLSDAEDRVFDTLEMVGLEERAEGYIANL